MILEEIDPNSRETIAALSKLATTIVKDYYDPIIGVEQNDYMLQKFQSEAAIAYQLEHGYTYYFILDDAGRQSGFLAFHPRGDELYLSKFYLEKSCRGKGWARLILAFLSEKAKSAGLSSIVLNVNRHNPTVEIYRRLSFSWLRDEKNDIGNGFYMDDYVLCYPISDTK